jgi:hypothetical protein
MRTNKRIQMVDSGTTSHLRLQTFPPRGEGIAAGPQRPKAERPHSEITLGSATALRSRVAEPGTTRFPAIDYHRKVIDTIGSAPQTAEWLRLFLAPGMGQCGGGEGLNTFDMVSALERWVEDNQPPPVGCCLSKHQRKAWSDSPVALISASDNQLPVASSPPDNLPARHAV